jgi:predicted enzyme related to lactoylglutathione lyase
MQVTGLRWAGTRTDKFEDTVRFLRDVMGLSLDEEQAGFASFVLPNHDKFEVFGPDEAEHSYFTTGPVVGFGVTDVDAAREELERSGIEVIGPVHSEGDYRWSHFRGPDGNVYEIASS